MKIERKKLKKTWIKHIREEGSKFHVISYNTNGSHCNIENCEINKPDTNLTIKNQSTIHFILGEIKWKQKQKKSY